MSLMRTFIRRTFALAAVITLAAALFVMPAQAKKKADPKTDPKTTTQTSPAPARARDAKGHFVKQTATTAPAPAVATRPAPTRDAKGRFVKQGAQAMTTAPAPTPTSMTTPPAASAPMRDAKGRFVSRGGASAPPTPVMQSPAGGGSMNATPGMVWVNLDSKVYHRSGDRWFGKTKNGKYMSEQDAIRAGCRVSMTK